MPTYYQVHPQFPQPRQVEDIAAALSRGAVMLYPTDTVYAIGCDVLVKSAVERVRSLKRLSNDKPLTFLCPSLAGIATYAQVSDSAYRFMRPLVPGPYTFILPATKLVPKLVQNPKRKTTGIRVPDHPLCQALLQTLGHPLVSTSAHLGDVTLPIPWEAEELEHLSKQVDLIIED
ncbi:MAG: L-threonylcarbamoyladenylate synthase, partial [Thermostichales cyanobacterium BF4_bins_65]